MMIGVRVGVCFWHDYNGLAPITKFSDGITDYSPDQ